MAIQTHCSLCSVQCGLQLAVNGAGRDGAGDGVRAVLPWPEFPVNEGRLCLLGRSTTEALLGHGERLTRPLVRGPGGELVPVSWAEALATVAARLQAIRERFGPQAVAVFGGASLSNEKCYLLGKFARLALGTPHFDYNGRYCMSSAAAGAVRALGLDRGLNMPLADLALTDCLLLAGANPAECQATIMPYFQAVRRRGGDLIVIDPRRTVTARQATLHLAPRPGTDLALANGLLHVLIAEDLVDLAFVDRRTAGFEAVARAVAADTPERVAAVTGVPAEQIREAARRLGRARSAVVLTGRGADQNSRGVDTTLAYINLALAVGAFGRPGSGFGTITGQGNGQGGREHGQKSDQLPGYRSIDDPAGRRHVAGVWGVPEEWLGGRGYTACEIFDAAGRGEIRALLVQAANPLVSSPGASAVARALAGLDLLVVVDVFLSETAAQAHVVLPGTLWAEDDGTVTNLEGRVLLRPRVLDPPGEAWPEWRILAALAGQLGAGRWFRYRSSEEIFAELALASRGGPADYSGIDYGRLRACREGIFWPCPSADHPGTPRPFAERFAHPDGRARFHPVTYRPPAEEPDAAYPFHLTTGRVRHHYLSGAQSRRVEALRQRCPEPFVEVHPDTARALGVAEGGLVELRSRRGRLRLPARVTGEIREDTVFVPFHWGGAQNVNALTNPALDPVSRMPELKVCAVDLARPRAGESAASYDE